MRLVIDARSASLGAIIDYAGVFPPASLTLDEAVSIYRRARTSETHWVVGRFLCPTSRLSDLAASLTRSIEPGEGTWEIATVFDDEAGTAASDAQDFHAEMQPAARIASAEARFLDAMGEDLDTLIDAITSVQPEIVPFIEVDRSASVAHQIERVATSLLHRSRIGGVKLRCAGTTADMFPSPDEVAEFIMEATAHHLPFKATAGLHQPIRHRDDGLDVWRHGFVNLLVAAAAAGQGRSSDTVTAIIAETDPDAFSMGTAFVSWRDISIPGPSMRRIRANGFVAFGSCEIAEPIAALADLAFIGDGA